jgi:hypothetical protein
MTRYVPLILLTVTPALAQDTSLAVWDKIYKVFSHPRCTNCHVDSYNVPIWSGPSYGPEPRPHGMNISGGTSRVGAEFIACGSCHTEHNSPLPHGPPGAPGWSLPPVEMQWFGKSSADICSQIKDRRRNGGRTIADVAKHIDHDGLVGWGWAPGPQREPAPYSRAELVEFVTRWNAAGAPCPTK